PLSYAPFAAFGDDTEGEYSPEGAGDDAAAATGKRARLVSLGRVSRNSTKGASEVVHGPFSARVDPFPTSHWVPARVGRGSLADSPCQTRQIRRTSSGADVPGRRPSLDARLLARSWERNARIRALGSQPPPSGSWVARGPDKRYAESGSPFCDSLLAAGLRRGLPGCRLSNHPRAGCPGGKP